MYVRRRVAETEWSKRKYKQRREGTACDCCNRGEVQLGHDELQPRISDRLVAEREDLRERSQSVYSLVFQNSNAR